MRAMQVWLLVATLILLASLGSQLAATERQAWLQWFPVQSQARADEYAGWLQADARPSEFPWLREQRQIWGQGLHTVLAARAVSAQLALQVSSESIGRALRGAYEATVGRLAEMNRDAAPTAEELLAAEIALQAADRAHVPASRFSYARALRRLWLETPWFGAHPVRKWERRYLLTTEYAAKALIGIGQDTCAALTRFSSGAPAAEYVDVMVDRWLDRLESGFPEIHRVRSQESGGELVRVPGGQALPSILRAIAVNGANFVSLGDARATLVLLDAPASWQAQSAVLVREPDLTRPREHVLMQVPVSGLAELLRRAQDDVRLEAVLR